MTTREEVFDKMKGIKEYVETHGETSLHELEWVFGICRTTISQFKDRYGLIVVSTPSAVGSRRYKYMVRLR